MIKIEWKTCLKLVISAFVLFLCIYYWEGVSRLLGMFVGALTPLVLGFSIAYVLNILMSFYEHHYFRKHAYTTFVKKSRPIVCLIASIFTLGAILALVIGLAIPELISCIKFLIAEIPPVVSNILKSDWVVENIPADWLAKLNSINWQDYISQALQVVISGLGSAANVVLSAVSSVFSAIISGVISVIFAIYLLISRDQLKRQSRRLVHCYLPAKWENKFLHWAEVLNGSFHRYIVGQCTEALILGALCTIGMLIFRFPYALMVGVLVGFCALIPVAGGYIGATVGAVMMLTESPLKSLLFLIFIVILQQIEGNVIYPKVVGKSIGLPAMWVLAAITIGGGLLGILGMLLGVPITSALYHLLREHMTNREREAAGLPPIVHKPRPIRPDSTPEPSQNKSKWFSRKKKGNP